MSEKRFEENSPEKYSQGVAVDLKFGFGWKSAHSFGFSSLDDIQKEKLSFFAFFEKFDFFYSKKKLFYVGHKA